MRTFILFLVFLLGTSCSEGDGNKAISLQLNWLHDPTFAGEYELSKSPDLVLKIKEGGPNVFPVGEVLSGKAHMAIVGADIFLQTLSKNYVEKGDSDLVAIFVDFQRNPVGWVLHPDAARKAGLDPQQVSSEKLRNEKFFQRLADGTLQIGDKRGTETTSIWLQWRNKHRVPRDIPVVPVGYDTSIVLGAPMLAYPVYLNEEPFKLGARIGEPVTTLDPTVDGVRLYGNVLITRRDFLEDNKELIQKVQEELKNSWIRILGEPSLGVQEVSKYYRGVSPEVLRSQIDKTLEFVFFETEVPGKMDTQFGGRWDQTLNALKAAGVVDDKLSLDIIRRHLLAPK